MRPIRLDTDWPVIAAGESSELLRRLVSAHKERSAWHLAGPLADRLTLALRGVLARAESVPDAGFRVVPVPSVASAVRRRGYDATWTLARRAARRLPGARARRVLRHTRAVADQAGLGRAERQRNLAGALVARPMDGRPCPVVIVDDLTTSGASLQEARRALLEAGFPVLGAAVMGAVGKLTGNNGRTTG